MAEAGAIGFAMLDAGYLMLDKDLAPGLVQDIISKNVLICLIKIEQYSLYHPVSRDQHPVSVRQRYHKMQKLDRNFEILVYVDSYMRPVCLERRTL